MKEAELLQKLWEHHVPGGQWSDVLEELDGPPEALPLSFFQPLGRPPLRQKQSGIQQYATPPNPGDGTWIIFKFLEEFVGAGGGRLFTGNLAYFPELRPYHLKYQVERFLNLPKYHNYPWKDVWNGWVEDLGRGSTMHIRENVKFCRDIRTEQQNKPGGFNGKWWIIGPKKQGW
jgi:hypothetical protein